MSVADSSIQTSMNVASQPGALALSPDSQFLLITHYGGITPSDPTQNGVTLINLKTRERQTIRTGDVPLGVAFLADNTALIVTTSSVLFFDPVSGSMQVGATFGGLAQSLPVDLATFP